MGKSLKSIRGVVCSGFVISALALVGCRTTGFTETATQRHADRLLALDVAENLRRSPDSTFPDVAVTANHGQVLLRGYVLNDALRVEAGQIAAQVPGVTGVENNLAVRPYAPLGAATAP